MIGKFHTGFAAGGGSATATTTPTITNLNDTYSVGSLTVGNHASYTNPKYFCEVYSSGGTKVLDDADITKDGADLSWTDPGTSQDTRTVKLRAQEFGDYIQSAEVTDTYVKNVVEFRYYRMYAVNSSGTGVTAHLGIKDWRFYTGSGGTGTKYPSDMTDYSTPTPYVASAGHEYSSTYLAWKAFDSSTTGTFAWTLGVSSAGNNWIGIDLGSGPPTLASIRAKFYSGTSTDYIKLVASNTGSFSGEEVALQSAFAIVKTSEPYNDLI